MRETTGQPAEAPADELEQMHQELWAAVAALREVIEREEASRRLRFAGAEKAA